MIRWGGTLLPSGNRAGDGMVCNSNNRRQWRKQGVAVGAAASRHKCHTRHEVATGCRNPYAFVWKAPGWPAQV